MFSIILFIKMRYIVIPLAIFVYVLWGKYAVKDIKLCDKTGDTWDVTTFMWAAIGVITVLVLFGTYVLPYVADNW